MLLTEALEDKDILFRQQFYPDQDHSIPKYHKHLYHSLTDFLINDCFKWLRAVSKPSIVVITIVHFDSRCLLVLMYSERMQFVAEKLLKLKALSPQKGMRNKVIVDIDQ